MAYWSVACWSVASCQHVVGGSPNCLCWVNQFDKCCQRIGCKYILKFSKPVRDRDATVQFNTLLCCIAMY